MTKNSQAVTYSRNRFIYGAWIVVVIGLGLTSRHFATVFPLFIGDILWALMVFLGFGFIFHSFTTKRIAAAAAIFATVIEVSQLYHAPWIDAIRRTRLGGLVLGFEFLWSDLLCYGVGILLGVLVENAVKRHCQRHNPKQSATK